MNTLAGRGWRSRTWWIGNLIRFHTKRLVPGPGECTILDLTLGPLDLTLLGLRVQLSEVDLLITGQPGTLLGGLLCGLAGLLDANGPLGEIVGLLNQILGILQGL